MSFFNGRHEKKQKGNNRNTHIHFNVMYILFIDDWLLCIVIASVEQWSALFLETGVQVQLLSSVGRLLFLIHANYKVMYNHCEEFIRCFDGALISSEVNTRNSWGSDPCKNVNRGITFVFYWSSWKKYIYEKKKKLSLSN